MTDNIQDKYNDLFSKYGKSNKSLGWGEKERSNLRFRMLTSEWDLSDKKILDFGCGFGSLKDYILTYKTDSFEYVGIDLNENFIETANKVNTFDKAVFKVQDILTQPLEANAFDYAFVSGTFNDFRADNYAFVEKVLHSLDKVATKGIAMNFLSSYAEIHYPHASYFDPSIILKLVYPVSKNIILRNDYMPYEFTVLLNKAAEIDTDVTVYKSHLSFL